MVNRKYTCDVNKSNQFSKLIEDYLYAPEKLQNLYKLYPDDNNWDRLISYKSAQNQDRKLLVEVLLEQHKDIQIPKVLENIQLLEDANTFTVCAAHQPLLFSGHAYFIHKILDIIHLAAHIQKQQPDHNIIPVFYIGTDDDDWDEIGKVSVLGHTYDYSSKTEDMSGRHIVDQAMLDLLDKVLESLSPFPYYSQTSQILKQSYRLGSSLASATRRLIYTLFGEYPILVVDADDPRFRILMKPAIVCDLKSKKTKELCHDQIEFLTHHYKVQAPIQNTNFFYIEENHRVKINPNEKGLEIGQIQVDNTDIDNWISSNSKRLSPNVIYRPLFQELILPNICFSGGGGEVAYWLQLKGLFDSLAIPMPALNLRKSIGVLTPKTVEELDYCAIPFEDLFLAESDYLEKYIYLKNNTPILENFKSDLDKSLESYLTEINSRYELSDNQNRYAHKTISNLHLHLSKKIKKHLRLKEQPQIDLYKSLRSKILPKETLQERGDSFIQYLAMYGTSLVQDIYSALGDSKEIEYIVPDTAK